MHRSALNSSIIMGLIMHLNSLSVFWLAESIQWIFEIGACDVITTDYTIIMPRTLKVTVNHVMYDCSAWFLKVIMSSLRTLCCLASVKNQKHDFSFHSMYNTTIVRFGFCDIQNNQDLGKGYQPQPSALADNPYLDLDYSGYHKNLIQ